MRYLLIFFVIYVVFKSLGKMLSKLKIMDTEEQPIDKQKLDPQKRIHVNEDDIEDADFKDVE